MSFLKKLQNCKVGSEVKDKALPTCGTYSNSNFNSSYLSTDFEYLDKYALNFVLNCVEHYHIDQLRNACINKTA